MSIASPPNEHPADFLRQLLDQQQQLTAVEQFSQRHDAGQLDRASGEPDQAAYYRELLPATPPADNEQYAFEVDLDACSGCKACVVACHSLNGLEDEESWRRVGTVVHESAELPVVQHVTTACHHCEDPGCLSGCPVKAYDKDPQTGIVRHLDDQCIGCKYCTMMCPYEVPQYSDRLGIVRKCDMCHQRLSVGEAPACVQSCPNQAIRIRLISRNATATGSQSPDARLAPGAPLSSITRPTTQYLSNNLSETLPATASMPQDASIDAVAENHWPLAMMLVATEMSVGLLVGERLLTTALRSVGNPMPGDGLLSPLALTMALVVAMLGMAIAPLHLGQPLRAWRVFLGLRTSWLSREAVLFGKYSGALALGTVLVWLAYLDIDLPASLAAWMPAWLVPALLWAATGLGVAGVHSSAMIYVATRRRLWRLGRTGPRFYGTALVGGLASLAAALMFADAPASWTLAIAAAAILAMSSKVLWERRTLSAGHRGGDDLDLRSEKLIRRELAAILRIRWFGAAASGATLLVAMAVLGNSSAIAGTLAMLSIGLLAGGELAERLLYFSGVVYDRMPGTLR